MALGINASAAPSANWQAWPTATGTALPKVNVDKIAPAATGSALPKVTAELKPAVAVEAVKPAAVEVKQRTTVEAALDAVTPLQRQRLWRALAGFAARRPRYRDAALRLDLIALAPGRRPRHIPAAWREDES